jgi:hypothetical protein
MNQLIKKSLLLIIISLAAVTARAQMGYDYAQYDLGIGGDINKVYGDAQTVTSSYSAHFNFNYNATPYVNYIVELQTGDLKGGDSLHTSTGRQFTNQYLSVMLRGQLQAGEILNYTQSSFNNAIKSLYLSTGVGIVKNDITNISRSSILTPGFYTPGSNSSTEIVIPARIGYEFKLYNKYEQPGFKIDIGYQYNFVLGDGLDGYTVGSHDSYSQYSIGIKFAIGGITSYRKQIPY